MAPYSPLTPPCLKALPHVLPVGRRRKGVATGAKVLGNGSIGRQKALGMTGGFAPLPPSLPLTGRPVGVLTPVMERAALPMFHTRHHLALGGGVARELIGNEHVGHIAQAFEQLFEEFLGRFLISVAVSYGQYATGSSGCIGARPSLPRQISRVWPLS